MRWFARWGWLAALLGLAACGGPPRGLYLDTEVLPPGAKSVTVHVATTRARLKADPGEMFTGERAPRLDYARLVVSVPPDHKPGQVEWPDAAPPDPTRHFAVVARRYGTGGEVLASVRREIEKRPPAERDVLVFVHGYNTSFDDAVFRMAQVVVDSGFKGVPVLFTWPSRAQLLAYPYDRESVIYSRDDLEAALDGLARLSGAHRINILAHSMGNMLTLEALRQAHIRGRGTFGGKLGDIMLAAPDVDVDVFRRQMQVIGDRHRKVTVFISKDDKALALSRRFWGGDNARVGAFDLTDPVYAERLKSVGIRVIDLTDLKGDGLAHGKFAASPEVVRQIGTPLADHGIVEPRLSLGERLATVGENVTDTVGTAAGMAVKLPVGIVGGVLGGVADGLSGGKAATSAAP